MPDYRLLTTDSKLGTAIKKEVERRRALYSERDTVMHNLRRYRLMRHTPYVPKAYQKQLGGEKAVKLPIMYRLVQTAVSSVTKRAPSVYAEPLSIGDRKAASELTRGLPLLLQAIDRMAPLPFLTGLYFKLFGDGLGVVKTQPGPWGGFPIPGDDEEDGVYNGRVVQFLSNHPLPFYMKVVDPLTCYPPMDEYGEGAFIESGWRTTTETLRSLRLTPRDTGLAVAYVPEDKPYPDLELPPGFPPTTRVDEIWTKDEVAIVLQNHQSVLVLPNTMGESPYTWGFADPTGVENPANAGMSVAYPLYYIAPWIDTMVGIMTAWSLFAAPTPYTTQEPGPGVRATQETKISNFQPGKMYDFPTGRKVGILSPPDVGAPVLQYLNFLIESADKGGLPALVSGSGIGTRLPALTFQAAFEAATDRLRPAVAAAENIIAGSLQKALNITGRYEIPIKVSGWEYRADDGDRTKRGWATIRPSEARKGRRIVVSLAIDSTQDLIAKGTHAQFMVSSGLWDIEKAMRFSGDHNPEDTKDKIAADTAWRTSLPVLAQATMMADPDMAAIIEAGAADENAGEAPGPGRNRQGVPAGRGGGKRGGPTGKPRGNRQGEGKSYGRT